MIPTIETIARKLTLVEDLGRFCEAQDDRHKEAERTQQDRSAEAQLRAFLSHPTL